ncbi:Ste18p KNAG_0D01480 [Huiozyma naganishii CBS 8797]|uniref:Guanine nucleotide-binding protein subunit gamma n=1 Tax=Huiozyma naganishii (strain ATCC MYA-139 / BCRC 22969 / CBS 8797 / KCTC 17520 / NBRC 10181 / NCYC 3082 / Yp74L-3) TaxID=1071383 RepID=J7R4X9_HUIN7|nr:hypothetical protein KNAG_0D01480 [Kazachstania naganishii CBS 8797]CCK69900.1 hypothetical protein KNAG_0D01480 [Kazachstania naganishii CBS 8797]
MEEAHRQQQLSTRIQLLKLKRLNELNNNLRNELSRERITASNACLTIINYCNNTRDYTLPEVWGYPQPGENHFRYNGGNRPRQVVAQQSQDTCCTIV